MADSEERSSIKTLNARKYECEYLLKMLDVCAEEGKSYTEMLKERIADFEESMNLIRNDGIQRRREN